MESSSRCYSEALGPALEELAVDQLGEGVASKRKQQWKKDMAVKFFKQLPAQQQDAITPLAESCRTGRRTSPAARQLRLPGAVQAVPEPPAPAAPQVEGVPLSSAASSSRRKTFSAMKPDSRRKATIDLAKRVLDLSSTPHEAQTVLQRVQQRADTHFGQDSSSVREDHSAALAKALQRVREALAASGDVKWVCRLDKEGCVTEYCKAQP